MLIILRLACNSWIRLSEAGSLVIFLNFFSLLKSARVNFLPVCPIRSFLISLVIAKYHLNGLLLPLFPPGFCHQCLLPLCLRAYVHACVRVCVLCILYVCLVH